MNTRLTRSLFTTSRAALSPLRSRPLNRARAVAVPSAESLTPATPSLLDRWFDPHLIDRLQMPLSRIRE